jgi:spore coat protein SA
MPPIKVAFVTPGSFVIPSATSSSVERVVENIAPLLDRERLRVRLYGRTGKHFTGHGTIRGIPCRRFPAADKKRYQSAIGKALGQFTPEIIQVENRPKFALQLRRRFPDRKIWLSLHSTSFISMPYIGKEKLRQCFQAVDRIIVNSEFLRDTVAARVPETAAKLRIVHLGVDPTLFPSRFSEEGQSLRKELRETRGWKDRSVVLFIGRLIPKKGVHRLLTMLPALAATLPDVLLVIVGSPYYGSNRSTPYSRELLRIAGPYRTHIRFEPYVPHSEVPGWFLAADAAVVPSGRNEAFGLVNVEAMACGIPVVAARSGGMKEIIEEGVTGFMVEPAWMEQEMTERLVRLLTDEELRRTMGIASRERVERHFTWRRAAERWMELLQETVDNGFHSAYSQSKNPLGVPISGLR